MKEYWSIIWGEDNSIEGIWLRILFFLIIALFLITISLLIFLPLAPN